MSVRVLAGRKGAKDPGSGPVVVLGGAGFIGTNLVNRLAGQGEEVVIFDQLSRAGVEQNLDWILSRHSARVRPIIADVCDLSAVEKAVNDASAVFHLAAQVAVTTSLSKPLHDFEVNARGTLNVLESLRRVREKSGRRVPLVVTSSNKVYGALGDVAMEELEHSYRPQDPKLASSGINESRPLDFHSPYGCSKGAADQYTLDYARSFDLPFVVLRMSCIYGPHQHGNEDQGWVAHFLIRALESQPITLYGNGKQVRDLLFVDDLVNALLLARSSAEEIGGRAFNLGGGAERAVSLLEVLDGIEKLLGRPITRHSGSWRVGDQRYYVSDHSAFSAATGWQARVSVEEGIRALGQWLKENRAAARRGALP